MDNDNKNRRHNDDQIINILLGLSKDMGEVKGSVKGVETHLGTLNSKVATQEKEISGVKQNMAYEKGRVKTIGSIWGVASGIFSSVVIYFLTVGKGQ